MLKLSEFKMTGGGHKRSVWTKGSPASWSSYNQISWQKRLRKSLLYYIGLELIIYLVVYFTINVIYRAVLSEEQQETFEGIVAYFKNEVSPLSRDLTFLLGFYVSLVIKRWWDQYQLLPWPDNLALLTTGLVVYESEEATFLSEELLRYQMLAYVLCLRKVSKVIRAEFQTAADIVDSGLATKAEMQLLEGRGELHTVWWFPLQWSMHSDNKLLLSEVVKFREMLEKIGSHQHVPIPSVYRQVVFLVIYFYFAAGLIGNQVLLKDTDVYFPFFLVLKFIFIVGWLKVAEALKNPFGDDGDDFEIGPLLSRHIWACGEHLAVGRAGLPPREPTLQEGGEEVDKLINLTIDKEGICRDIRNK